ncbi:hypothetical protein Fmac_032840 [Flemingia macrophylla]|uniref:Uncharacterized protein n=1 Tax=Flemingia macrophylla TaxID=520843 RepID=A0ABD1L633_9FABA
MHEMMPLSLEEFMMRLRDTFLETRKLESKLDALVNLVTRLAANRSLPFVAIVCGIHSSNDHGTSRFGARNDAIVIRGVHDTATRYISAETRKLESKLDALVNLVTRLAANRCTAFVAIVYGIRSSNNHGTSVCPSSQQSERMSIPEAYAANTFSRPPQQQRQGT